MAAVRRAPACWRSRGGLPTRMAKTQAGPEASMVDGTSPPASGAVTRLAEPLIVAVPKGRVLQALAKRLAPLGVSRDLLLADDRTLVRHDIATNVRFLLLKPDDVPTYVEYGAADLGVVGRDVLLEREYDLYAPLDLGIGICHMAVAGKPPT